jgi:hypothetical protein
VPLIPHSDELGALARALTRTTRALSDWFGLAHSAPTSDVHCRHPSTGAAAPATASATGAPQRGGARRNPEAQGASTFARFRSEGVKTPRTSTTLPDPTTRIASAHRSSRELGPLRRIHAFRATPRRALTAPWLRRNCTGSTSREAHTDAGTPLTGSCNSIFKDEHPSSAPIAPTLRSERASHFTTLGSLRLPGTRLGCRRCLPTRTAAPAASGVPHPLPRRRVNDAEFNASSEHLRSRSAAASPPLGFHRAPAWPADHAISRNRQRARTSTTTLTDFCNRRKARAHWRTIVTRRSAAFHGEALRLAARRRCETAPTVRARSQRRASTEASSGTRPRHPSHQRRPRQPGG